MYRYSLLSIGLLLAALVFLLTCDDNAVDSSDKTPPDQITTLNTSGQPADTVILRWLATGDDGTKGRATEYDIRYSTDYITDRNWAQATVVPDPPRPTLPGYYQHFTVHDMDSTVNYYFAVKVADDVGNWSPLSNIAQSTDTIPPARVTDLTVTSDVTGKVLTLEWTAPGDDSMSFTVTEYDIRSYTDSITEENWDSALPVAELPIPMPPGEVQQLELDYPDLHQVYFFALKAVDERGNWSELSNVAARYPDTTAPGPITDLSVVNVDTTSVTLSWAAPGDDGYEGTATTYAVKYATDPITEENWASAAQVGFPDRAKTAGETEHFKLTGLQVNSAYYFAVKTVDESGNWSALSNVADTITGDTTLILWTKVIDLPGDQIAAGLAVGSDGGIMIAGVTGTYGNHDALLVKTDADGNLLWQKTYGGAEDDYAADIITTSDGCFAMCGSTSSSGAGEEDAWLVKLDANGNVLWEQTFGGARDDRAKSVAQTSDGGYALIGENCSFDDYCPIGYLIKTDQAGIEEWYETFYWNAGCEQYYPPHVTAFDIIATSDGNIVFSHGAGYGYFEYTTHGGLDVCLGERYRNGLYKIDCLSNLIWSESETDVYIWDPIWSIFELDNQELIWVRELCEVARASSNGVEIWEVGPEGFSARQLNDLVVGDAERIVVVGNATGDLTDTYLLSLDMSGNILRELSFNEPGDQDLVAIKSHVEGRLVAAGSTDPNGTDSDILLILLNRAF